MVLGARSAAGVCAGMATPVSERIVLAACLHSPCYS